MCGGCYGSSLFRWLAQSAGEGTPVKDGGEQNKEESTFEKKELGLVESVQINLAFYICQCLKASLPSWPFVGPRMKFDTKSTILYQQSTN